MATLPTTSTETLRDLSAAYFILFLFSPSIFTTADLHTYVARPLVIMSLSILSDDQIRVLLESLTLEELEAFRDKLKESLHDYSNGVQSTDDGTLHQPLRTSVQRKGVTTLFMPSSSPVGYGVKGNVHWARVPIS